jgi:hypothetical protein
MIASMRALLVVLASAALLAACGDDEPEDNAVEATEQNTAERPMVLEIGDPAGSGTARIQLDL